MVYLQDCDITSYRTGSGLLFSVGQLRDKDDKPFEFVVYRRRQQNQRRYERLGEVILHKLS